ncbi:Endonuclease/exonuclease/phosphatase, partial [Tylopilus felleus]
MRQTSHPAQEDRVLTPRVKATALKYTELEDCVRLCIFNVGSTTVAEAWSELVAMLPWDEYRHIVKLQRVTNASTHPRIDMWVRGGLGASLVRELREMTRRRSPSFVKSLQRSGRLKDYHSLVVSGWRFAVWQSWRDRRTTDSSRLTSEISLAATHSGMRLATLNVNGFPSKREQVSQFLEEERITVCTLQETLVSTAQYPIIVPGFRTYARAWQEGFRGLAVLVRTHLPSYEVPHGKEKLEGYKYLLHVKIARIPGLPGHNRSLHFVGVYLPSGGNMRAGRTAGIKALSHLYESILRREVGALVVAMGDFNCKPPELIKKMAAANGLHYHQPRGSPVTRFPARGAPASLDHMVASPVAKVFCVRPRVARHWAMSDHRPLISALRVHTPAESEPLGTKVHYDRRKLARHSFELINDNRWLSLLDLEVADQKSLSDLASALSSTLADTTTAHGIRVDSGSTSHPYFPRRLKVLLAEYRKESAAVADFLDHNTRIGYYAQHQYLAARATFRKSLKEWRRGEKTKHYSRIAEDFVVHDHKQVWSRLKSQIDTRDYGGIPPPVRNKAGTLCVDSNSHVEAVKEHYQALAQDDPLGTSRDEKYW